MARDLTQHFLAALQNEFPFLRGWKPVLNSAHRPVTFQVTRVLDPNTTWSLAFGRYNNAVDTSYTNGVTWVGLINGETMEWVELNEGETTPADVLKDDTQFVLVKNEYRSELVCNEPGNVEYTLYKRGQLTVAAIQLAAARTAAAMRAELE